MALTLQYYAERSREMVREFHTVFGLTKGPELWGKLIEEEAGELSEAIRLDDGSDETSAERLKETCDLLYVTLGFQVAAEGLQEPVILSKDTLMTISVAIAEAIGFYGQDAFFEAFRRVHESNMSKLGDDGRPVRREDGKILKGPNYRAPDLMDLAA